MVSSSNKCTCRLSDHAAHLSIHHPLPGRCLSPVARLGGRLQKGSSLQAPAETEYFVSRSSNIHPSIHTLCAARAGKGGQGRARERKRKRGFGTRTKKLVRYRSSVLPRYNLPVGAGVEGEGERGAKRATTPFLSQQLPRALSEGWAIGVISVQIYVYPGKIISSAVLRSAPSP